MGIIKQPENPRDANQLTRAYMDSILVEPRYLGSCTPDISMELFGKRFSSPIMIAAFSHLSGTHTGGMPEMARGAKLAGICNWAGMGDEKELSDILATGAETIKIVKPYANREAVFDMLEFAKRSGALAVGMDIDHSFDVRGKPDVVLGLEMKPVSEEELADFVRATDLPFIVKGVLSEADAEKCARAGVRGILLSHHHGIMPYAIPPLMALPKIRAAIGNQMEIYVDCGIETGCDAFKALAMGAKAVCVGRSILPSLKENGAQGVKEYVDNMADELRGMMARTASRDLAHIAGDLLWDASTGKKIVL
ncbi:MAG: alpha-hydroxy acid oxidase [Eubacteriales bacterium]|nr:alpha-hydroxy acid oxidase [Eubacteriales bacterium]MDD3881311.1 alpha-hydroxy acid oxidase [Eubacteriales bacterium]MDD4512229.1 alpha-hydroxy acid oxidase [Eubacteriales bacterium]